MRVRGLGFQGSRFRLLANVDFELFRFRASGPERRSSCSGCRVQGVGFRVQGSGCRTYVNFEGFGFWVSSLGFRVPGFESRVWGAGFRGERVQGVRAKEFEVSG